MFVGVFFGSLFSLVNILISGSLEADVRGVGGERSLHGCTIKSKGETKSPLII